MSEMRVVLDRVLERANLIAADAKTSKVQFRVITLAPKSGVRVVQTRPPLPAFSRTGWPRTADQPAVP
jgi:hypothetical protein